MESKAASLSTTPGPAIAPRRGMRPWRALGTVRRLEFETPDYQFESIPFSGDAPILEGRLHETQLQPGVWLHCAEVCDLHSMASRTLLEAGLRLVLILAGELDVGIGGNRLHLSGASASAALVAMPKEALFERQWKRGKWERKLSLHFTPQWLAAWAAHCQAEGKTLPGPVKAALCDPGHSPGLQVHTWRPSRHAIALAEQLMLETGCSDSGLQALKQSGLALELLHEALSQCEPDQPPPLAQSTTGLKPRDLNRMLRVRSFLDAEIQHNHDRVLSIEELGRYFGLSTSALQRHFRQAFGFSINEYRRNMRLLQARTDLQNGLSINDAAHRAGYTTAANFATAFRRHFGISPRVLLHSR